MLLRTGADVKQIEAQKQQMIVEADTLAGLHEPAVVRVTDRF